MTQHAGIFPTFFLSGFECSTFLWRGRQRRDLVDETRHREHALAGYQLQQQLGIAAAREGVPWPSVEHAGGSDFSLILKKKVDRGGPQ